MAAADEPASRARPLRRPFVLPVEDGVLIGVPFQEVLHGKYRLRSISHTCEIFPCDPGETFHDFVIRLMAEKMGRDWLKKERAKILVTPHPISAWVNEYFAFKSALKPDPDRPGVLKGMMTGNIRALHAFAWDFYTVAHCAGNLLPSMVNRLRLASEFQGTRYELAVAAIALRAGFEIEWMNDDVKHVEFHATHRSTREKVAFEAKSHHRDGVLGQPGTFDPEAAKIKVLSHIEAAVSQAPNDLPLIVFDDLNFPLTPGVHDHEKPWFKMFDASIQKHGAKIGAFALDSVFVACFMTNFSWHFMGTSDQTPRENEYDVLFCGGAPAKFHVQTGVLDALRLAVEQYGHVPARLHEKRPPPAP